MILKLVIKENKKTKKNQIIVWIQKGREFEKDVQQIFNFFKESIMINEKIRKCRYYKVTSKNPAIMLSLFSALQEIIPDIYFITQQPNSEEDIENFMPISDMEPNI
ncbi:MAG: hypothetical protein ACTSQJ_13945 [Promethearchaeota archaeon]